MKNRLILLLLAFSIYSCKQNEVDYDNNQSESNNNTQSDDNAPTIDANNVRLPDEDQIKNDLLGKSISGWTFKKLDEFDLVDILNSKIVNNNTLELTVDLDLTDYFTHDDWDGEVIISYELKNDNQWHYLDISGDLENNNKDDETPRLTRNIEDPN